MTYLMLLGGLICLFVGGELLVRGAVGTAARLRIPPFIIGLTIVGFGTSAPELLVSIQAALAGAPDLAVGNVVGSNIANILLILGLTAVVLPVPMRYAEGRRDYHAMIGVSLLLWLLVLQDVIQAWHGALLVLLLVLYLGVSISDRSTHALPDAGPHPAPRPLWKGILLIVGGFVALVLGARFLVFGATDIARVLGVSEAVIGLTVIAVGTSLPELATSVMAAFRKHSELAVGNILGSNIFNVLSILGFTSLVAPIPVDPRFADFDLPVATGAALVMLAFAVVAGRVGRLGGGILLASYAAYLFALA